MKTIIEFCGNCGLGAETHRDYPGSCPFYSKGEDPERRCTSWTCGHFLHTRANRVVYIASPMKGDIEGNLRRAAEYCRAAVESHATPIAPHLFFSKFLNDRDARDRSVGMQMGISLLERCDELWAFGKPTEGMRVEIARMKRMNKPIIYVPEETVRELNERSKHNG